jgi:putative membrane protein insertion efficiency factor
MSTDPQMPDPVVGERSGVGLESGLDSGLEAWTLRCAFRVYKSVFSPLAHALSPTQCLYLPTCSEYAYVALARFGVVRGSWLALRRLARCHPFAKGGLDPVPQGKSPLKRGIHGDHLS